MHLSKPHEDAGALVVNLVNPTAGLFDGDEVEIIARVNPGARLVLTTPSANRIYKSRSGSAARVIQKISAGTGSFVEFIPEPIIPQAGAIYDQRTVIHAEAEAEVIFFEWLAPGRVASGEAFRYQQLDWHMDISSASLLVARERYQIRPGVPATIAPLTHKFPLGHYLGAFVITNKSLPPDQLGALSNESTYLGWSQLQNGGWCIKALCADSLSTRRLLEKLRRILYLTLERRMPHLGRF